MQRLISPDEPDDRDEIDDLYETHGDPVGAVRSLVRRVIDGVVRMIVRDETECVGR
jgi:hypothetical protein